MENIYSTAYLNMAGIKLQQIISWLVLPSPLFQRVHLLSYFLAGMYYHAFLPVPLTFQPPTFSCLWLLQIAFI